MKVRETPPVAEAQLHDILSARRPRGRDRLQADYVKVVAPSTTANLGPGFDVFGLAHSTFDDVLEIELTSQGEIEVEVTGIGSEHISCDINGNSAGLVAKIAAEKSLADRGLKIHIQKGIPVSKGLGSSGASAAGCIVGLNRLLELGLSNDQMIQLAAEGEVASAGSPHADNVAASVLGGFTIVQSYEPFHAIKLAPPSNLGVALAVPDAKEVEKKTKAARAVLPASVPMKNVIHNIGHASTMIVGLLSGDLALFGRGMVDSVVEPVRAKLLPCYSSVRQRALAAGAVGVAISGAGPTVISIVDERAVASIHVAQAMKEAFNSEGIACEAFASKPTCGAHIVEER